MPNPQEIFTVLGDDLQAVGIKVNGVPRPWNGGFKDDVQQFGKHDLHILGWTGDYNDPGNFVGTFFGREKDEFGDEAMTDMFAAIGKADATVDDAAKKAGLGAGQPGHRRPSGCRPCRSGTPRRPSSSPRTSTGGRRAR